MWQKNDHQFDQHTWNSFVETYGPESGRFLQSWEWGEFQKSFGIPMHRYVESVEEKIIAIATVMNQSVSVFGSYAYCPRGPIVREDYEQSVSALATFFSDALFFRCDPPSAISQKRGWQKTVSIQPACTWMTDLALSEEELFSRLHKKTRYNIGLAERAEIDIQFNTRDIEIIWPLFEQTAKRGQFRLHTKEHYQKLLETIPFAFFATAWKDGRPIAANLMIDFGGVRTYVHGASSYNDRAFMAPHLLHWELMKDAKMKGLEMYDWWGVCGTREEGGVASSVGSKTEHPWAGISRFKRSFYGRDVSYPGTYDLVQKPFWYKVYRLVRQIRRAV